MFEDRLWLSLDACIRKIEFYDEPAYFFMRHSIGLFDSPFLTDFNELTIDAGWDWILHFDLGRLALLTPNGDSVFYIKGRAEGDSAGAIDFLNILKLWQKKREDELRPAQELVEKLQAAELREGLEVKNLIASEPKIERYAEELIEAKRIKSRKKQSEGNSVQTDAEKKLLGRVRNHRNSNRKGDPNHFKNIEKVAAYLEKQRM